MVAAALTDPFCEPDSRGSHLMFQMWHPVPLNRWAVGADGMDFPWEMFHCTQSDKTKNALKICYTWGCTCKVFGWLGCIDKLLYPLQADLPSGIYNYPKFLLSTNCMIRCACPLVLDYLDPKMCNHYRSIPICRRTLSIEEPLGARSSENCDMRKWRGDAWVTPGVDWISMDMEQYSAILGPCAGAICCDPRVSWVIWCPCESLELLEYVWVCWHMLESSHLLKWITCQHGDEQSPFIQLREQGETSIISI